MNTHSSVAININNEIAYTRRNSSFARYTPIIPTRHTNVEMKPNPNKIYAINSLSLSDDATPITNPNTKLLIPNNYQTHTHTHTHTHEYKNAYTNGCNRNSSCDNKY